MVIFHVKLPEGNRVRSVLSQLIEATTMVRHGPRPMSNPKCTEKSPHGQDQHESVDHEEQYHKTPRGTLHHKEIFYGHFQ